jgi:hypothetical protein
MSNLPDKTKKINVLIIGHDYKFESRFVCAPYKWEWREYI